MKVKELIKKLEKIDPDFEIVLSKDAEGNSFSPLSDLSEENYEPEETWFGYLSDAKNNAVVFWPIN